MSNNYFTPHAYDIEIRIPRDKNKVSLEEFKEKFTNIYNFSKVQINEHTSNKAEGIVYCSGDVHIGILRYELPQNRVSVTLVAHKEILDDFIKRIIMLFGDIDYSIPEITVLNVDLDSRVEGVFIAPTGKNVTGLNMRLNIQHGQEKYDMMFVKSVENNRLYLNIENNSQPIWHNIRLDSDVIMGYINKVKAIVNEYIDELIGE